MTERLDRTDADRILAGDPGTEETVPEVAALLRAAAVPSSHEPSAALITAMASEARSSLDLHTDPPRSRPVYAKFLTAKVAAAAAIVAFTATGAAAATGTLPSAAQDGIAKAVGHVGIDLPRSDDDDTSDLTEENGPVDNHGADVTDVVDDEYDTGADKGAAVSDVANGDHDTAADDADEVETPNHGDAADDVPASDDAPVTTPNDGTAADDAPPVDTEHDGATTAEDAKTSHAETVTGDEPTDD